MNTYKYGKYIESYAIIYLKNKGHNIIGRNKFFGKFGEIDIISTKKDVIYFVEVKGRRSNSGRMEYNSFNRKKYKKILKLGDFYCNNHKKYISYKRRFLLVTINIIENSAIIKLYNIFDF